jgi:hypothetical protein
MDVSRHLDTKSEILNAPTPDRTNFERAEDAGHITLRQTRKSTHNLKVKKSDQKYIDDPKYRAGIS